MAKAQKSKAEKQPQRSSHYRVDTQVKKVVRKGGHYSK